MSNFTKGPWNIDRYGNLKVEGDYVRFSGLCLTSSDSADANTRFISAAPDMYEALMDARSALRYIREWHGDLYGVGFVRIEENSTLALNKADGKGDM